MLTVDTRGVEALFFDSVKRTCVPYMRRTWECATADVLSRVEDAIYEDPLLLDDYRTSILVRPSATLLLPPHMVDEDDYEGNARALDVVDAAEYKDVWCERIGETTALFSTPGGVKDFLSRSFLTEDVHHILKPMVEHFAAKAKGEGGEKVWVHVGHSVLDMVAFRNGKLLHAGSWKCTEAADAAYFILFAWRALRLDPAQGELRVSGDEKVCRNLMTMLRRHINYVGLTITATLMGNALRSGVGMNEALILMS